MEPSPDRKSELRVQGRERSQRVGASTALTWAVRPQARERATERATELPERRALWTFNFLNLMMSV